MYIREKKEKILYHFLGMLMAVWIILIQRVQHSPIPCLNFFLSFFFLFGLFHCLDSANFMDDSLFAIYCLSDESKHQFGCHVRQNKNLTRHWPCFLLKTPILNQTSTTMNDMNIPKCFSYHRQHRHHPHQVKEMKTVKTARTCS
jgi:hypothetical protein